MEDAVSGWCSIFFMIITGKNCSGSLARKKASNFLEHKNKFFGI